VDTALFLTIFLFAVQLIAQGAAMKWPQHRVASELVFWPALIGAVFSLLWYGYSNFDWIVATVNAMGRKTVGITITLFSVAFGAFGLSLIGGAPPPGVRPSHPPSTPRQSGAVGAPTSTLHSEHTLFARARFLYDQRTDSMSIISRQGLEVATLDRESSILHRPSYSLFSASFFVARFGFANEAGPFDVDVIGAPLGPTNMITGLVVENEKSFVKIEFFQALNASAHTVLGEPPTSAEVTVSFYRK